MKPTARVDHWVYLHTVQGMSTQQIADEVSAKKNTVLVALRNRGVLRQAPGREIERQVFHWLVGKTHSLMRTKGDRPYDLIVGDCLVDVKSAKLTKDRKDRYTFVLRHTNDRRASKAHEYWFVLKDRPGRPVYRCRTSAFTVKRCTSISVQKFENDPKFSLVGYLG